jgi:thiol:disulfide interchange protein DsbA
MKNNNNAELLKHRLAKIVKLSMVLIIAVSNYGCAQKQGTVVEGSANQDEVEKIVTKEVDSTAEDFPDYPARPVRFKEKLHYMPVFASHYQDKDNDKIQVIEMFLYGCPHCYELDPKIAAWAEQHDNVELIRVPAILGPTWAEMAKFYYVAEKLGVLDQLHQKFFEANAIAKKQYYSELAIRQFFQENGVNDNDFNKAYFDKGVMAKTSRARALSIQYKLRGVPAVIVNNKWKTAPYYVKNQEEMLEVLDYLIELEQAGGGQQK